jgi:hypothetical protein
MHRDEVRILKRKKGQQRATGSQKVPRKLVFYQQAIAAIYLHTKTAVAGLFSTFKRRPSSTTKHCTATADIPASTAANTPRKRLEIAQVCA